MPVVSVDLSDPTRPLDGPVFTTLLSVSALDYTRGAHLREAKRRARILGLGDNLEPTAERLVSTIPSHPQASAVRRQRR